MWTAFVIFWWCFVGAGVLTVVGVMVGLVWAVADSIEPME